MLGLRHCLVSLIFLSVNLGLSYSKTTITQCKAPLQQVKVSGAGASARVNAGTPTVGDYLYNGHPTPDCLSYFLSQQQASLAQVKTTSTQNTELADMAEQLRARYLSIVSGTATSKAKFPDSWQHNWDCYWSYYHLCFSTGADTMGAENRYHFTLSCCSRSK